MKIIITGGAGFIGKHLADFLLNEKHEVTILDNFSNSTKESINSLVSKGVNVIEGDITNSEFISKAFEKQEVVIHLAAKISVDESIINPEQTFLINADGTANVINACKLNKVKKIIAASSAAVYGEGELGKKLSEKSRLNPVSPYGKSKIMMEKLIQKELSSSNVKYDILRFFNIYGQGQTVEYAGVITKFINKIKQNNTIEVFGDGTQTRDFVNIQDVVDSIENSIQKIEKKNGVYNIASGKSICINELAKLLLKISGKKLEIKYLPERKGDIKFSQADITLAKKDLEYLPKYRLEEIKKLFES